MSLVYFSKYPMRHKYANMSAMGDLRLVNTHSATGDAGRLHPLTTGDPQDQARSAFGEMQRQMDIDSNNESNQFSVGSDQSKTAKLNVDDLIERSPTPVRIVDAKHYGGGYYHPNENYIGLDKKKDVNILAHELGHAEFQKSTLGKITQSNPSRFAHISSPFWALAGGIGMSGSGKQRALQSLVLALGLSAPTLLSEGVASYKGYHILKEHGATPEELEHYKKTIAGPQSGYLVTPALATGVGFLASSAMAGAKTAKARTLARRMLFKDLEISIETDKGDYREWYDPHNKETGRTLMQYPYGYIRGTKGMDGDHVDCFIGPNVDAKEVYVITTNKSPNFDRIDEQKVMLGFDSAGEAKRAFMSSYSNPRFFHSMNTWTYDDFKNRVYKTLNSRVKKIGSNVNFDGLHDWSRNSAGPAHDQVPGDYLGFPASSLVGLRQVEGNPMAPSDRIDRMFRFNDQETNTRVLDGDVAAAPADPAV